MSTYTQILYQIVFSTKNRENTLEKPHRDNLYKYIWGVLKNNSCHVYRIGGTENHIHIVTHLHPAVSLALVVKDIKVGSSSYIRSANLFDGFNGWQEGYGAFTYSINAKDNLIEYVKNQESQHRITTFNEEYIKLLKDHSIAYDDLYLF